MGLFSIFSKTTKLNTEWQELINSASDYATKQKLKDIVDIFLFQIR